ncbi:hypothetical protein RFI_18564 [Reticulomyxa filosa]|uniref:Uncharacterized protein n=1 Tax=Reticulomyxa filosa TaxID=46433 RepID=X6MYX7_RETFI|nr:hypothetical protein RFI_18564 [Reticulomyxa filosa]|eukprot:ETO18694.1 hypothetical protein RFI_18564 [Reticulomyxa filosa]
MNKWIDFKIRHMYPIVNESIDWTKKKKGSTKLKATSTFEFASSKFDEDLLVVGQAMFRQLFEKAILGGHNEDEKGTDDDQNVYEYLNFLNKPESMHQQIITQKVSSASQVHRWKYSQVKTGITNYTHLKIPVVDHTTNCIGTILLCGDAFLKGQVEGAMISSFEAAFDILDKSSSN